jgi:cyclophilin family peptidyl-prolyl cis-trans isomerase
MAKQWSLPFDNQLEEGKTYTATLDTSHGAIEVEFYPEDAPIAVNNFVSLAKEGFYDGTPFHRIVKGFVIQGGDPTGTGTGGPGYRFKDEAVKKDYEKGVLAMANAGPNTNGSQFFIVTAEACPWLDDKHTVFGRVADGMDVVDRISELPRDAGDRPREDVAIERVELS